jgi:hypothetical protein
MSISMEAGTAKDGVIAAATIIAESIGIAIKAILLFVIGEMKSVGNLIWCKIFLLTIS